MPDAPVIDSPVTETPAAGGPAASSQSAEQPSSGRPFDFASAFDDYPASSVSETPPTDPKPAASGTDGETPADAGSKPADAPTPDADAAPKSRRAEAREANLRRIAELEQEVQTLRTATPADPDADREVAIAAAVEAARAEERDRIERERTEEAERAEQTALSQKHLQDVERLQKLMRLPDSALSAEDYNWREEQKELLAKYPEVEQHYRTVAQQEAAAARAESDAAIQRHLTAWDGEIRGQLAKAATLPNVNPDDLKANAPNPLTTWDQMASYYHAAGAAWKDAEYAPQIAERDATISRQQDEINDLRLVGPRGLGSSRAPVTGGRSSAAEAGPQQFDPSRSPRENLSDALMAPASNGGGR